MENISFNSNNILNINAILHNLNSKLNFKFELEIETRNFNIQLFLQLAF